MYNTIRLFIRALFKKKTISLITIGGFAISMSVVITLSVFIFNENQVNKGFPHAQNIYRIKLDRQGANVPKTLMDDMVGKVPGVEKMCLYSVGGALYQLEDQKYFAQFLATNNDFLKIFSFQFIYQTPNPTLSIKDNIILTRTFSEKLYGEKNPVGEKLQINDTFFNVVGVVNDPVNSSFSFDAITNYETAFSRGGIVHNKENHEMFKSFVLLHQASNVEEINNQISGMLNHWEAFREDKLSLQPLDQVYFDTESHDDMEHANVEMIYLLMGITAIILIMSIFNYVNLTISQGHERLNEIGIKKTSGASKRNIFSQFITESLIVSLFAMTLAILLTSAVAPLFSEILGKKIELHQLFTKSKILLFAIPIILFVGIISGTYPALIVSKVPPIQILKNQKKIGNKNGGLIALQFMITITLILSLLFINKQLGYVKNKDLGFDKDLMIRMNLNGNSAAKWQVLKQSFLSSPEIISVTASQGAPLIIYSSTTGSFDDVELEDVKGMAVDEDFLKTFGLTLISGRDFEASDKNVCLINEHLYKHLEWDDFSGKNVFGKTVIGVIKDFHHNNLYHQIGHIQLTKMDEFNPSYLSIKIRGNISESLKFIQKTFNEVEPGTPFIFDFYDEWVRQLYQKEEKQAYAIQVFTLLAILISCLGLVGMAENVTKRKIKEIGIRKVNGAKIWEVMTLLNKDFVIWVAIAFVVAAPISWYAMNKWLENFAYKTELSWWIFALAGLMALGIALLTVSWQSWRAATRNPVEALRYE